MTDPANTPQDTDIADEHYRIHVPSPDVEVVIGKGTNNFIGFMARAAEGGMFLGAGGYPFGIPSADSTYAGFKRAHTTLTIALAGVASAVQVFRSAYLLKEASAFSVILNSLGLAVGTIPGTIAASTSDGTASAEGTVSIYADKSVAIASPLGASLTSGVAASLTGGAVASVNSVIASSVNGIVASLNGAYSSTVAGHYANVLGDGGVCVASRSGTTRIEGAVVNVGRESSIEAPGMAYGGFMTGGQVGTDWVNVRADKGFGVTVGSTLDKMLMPFPTGLEMGKTSVEIDAGDANALFNGNVILRSGGSAMTMKDGEVSLFVAPDSIGKVFAAARGAAMKARNEAKAVAEEIDWTLENKLLLGILGGVVGTAVALPVTLTQASGSAGAKAGIAVGGTAAGIALGALGVLGVAALITKKIASTAKEKAQQAANAAYKTASDGAQDAYRAALKGLSSSGLPPTIKITPTDITLSVTPAASIKISATAIEIKGLKIKINGQDLSMAAPPSTVQVGPG